MEYIILITLLAIAAEVYYFGKKHAGTKKFTSTRGRRLMFVDTSVLIDGRIVEIAKSGFIPGVFAVPRSVVGELQFLADNADAEKRSKARKGLDNIQELKSIDRIDFLLFQDGSVAKEGVDERLLTLAKDNSGMICTIDYNLNKVAVVEGIEVLNVNELAQTLRMAHLPGDRITIELVQKGQDSHQAVGYLPDGTMVVVENAQQHLNKTKEVEVIRSIQTAAGKMMFARLNVNEQSLNKGQDNKSEKFSKQSSVRQKVLKVPAIRKQKQQSKQPTSSVQTQSTKQQPSPKQAKQPRGKNFSGGKKNQEDLLIELVNKQ